MDYFIEIAENPDIQETLGRLYYEANYPEDLQQTRPGDDGPLLSDTHPSIWRAELVNWFHLHPDFAAAVWRELAFCISERKRLARAPWAAPMKKIGLEATADEIEKERKFADATSAEIENLRKELGIEYRGPEFIERLILLAKRPRSTETIAALITNVTEVRKLAEIYGVPVPFAMVHEREMEQIFECRKGRSHVNSGEPDAANDANGGTMPSFDGAPIRRALANDLVGLAFSGGGIRSATFNLGVLQSLANLDVLRHCDYLSTVSGGGYIGSWFSAWTLREAQQIATTSLTPNKRAQDRMRLLLSPLRSPYPLDTCIRPIRYLREFSNYLTPQTGFFSADTWTMIAIYFRNLLLNLLVLIPLITTVLLTPHFLFGVTQWLFNPENDKGFLLILFLISISFCVPLYVLIRNLRRTTPPLNTHQMIDDPGKQGVDHEIPMPRFARQPRRSPKTGH